MSKTLAAWIHVTPSPTTLAESSAVLRHLKKHAQVSVFLRQTPQVRGKDDIAASSSSTSYYAVFQQPLPNGYMTFDVPVHHDIPRPEDADPYNVRGLTSRKPYPSPKLLKCILERESKPVDQVVEELQRNNPYRGSFQVQGTSELRKILVQSGAPRSIANQLNPIASEKEDEDEFIDERLVWHKEHPLPMNSLMRPWRKAVGKDNEVEEVKRKREKETDEKEARTEPLEWHD